VGHRPLVIQTLPHIEQIAIGRFGLYSRVDAKPFDKNTPCLLFVKPGYHLFKMGKTAVVVDVQLGRDGRLELLVLSDHEDGTNRQQYRGRH